MSSSLYKCGSCGKYTMMRTCRVCGTGTKVACPPRFSPEDRWGKYRRMLLYNIEERQDG